MRKILSTLATLLLICNISYAESYLPSSRGEVVRHKYYTLSYIESDEQPEWVYYTLTPEMLSGETPRSSYFRADKSVSTGSATPTDYKGSGYDRGHLCPAGSMTVSKEAMSESFFMSNMSPQAPSFNRGVWKRLEERVRDYVKSDSILYVVTGPILGDSLGSIGTNKVTIPKYYYKALYSPKRGEMIAFVLENKSSSAPLESFAITIDKLEDLLGIDFFGVSNEALESRIDISAWQ